jgi:hypothetical protein
MTSRNGSGRCAAYETKKHVLQFVCSSGARKQSWHSCPGCMWSFVFGLSACVAATVCIPVPLSLPVVCLCVCGFGMAVWMSVSCSYLGGLVGVCEGPSVVCGSPACWKGGERPRPCGSSYACMCCLCQPKAKSEISLSPTVKV